MASKKVITKQEALERISDFWDLLTPEEQTILWDKVTLHTYRKNEVIYFTGEEAHSLMCMLSGRVKIYRNGSGGRRQIMRVSRTAQYFGFRAYFAGETYQTEAAALEKTEICMMPMPLVEKCVMSNPKAAMFFIRLLSSELGQTEERALGMTQKYIRSRIAETLLFLKENYGLEADGATLSIYLSREDLANMSNMTTSNAIRTLSAFADEQVIAIDGRKIKIMSEENLMHISKMG